MENVEIRETGCFSYFHRQGDLVTKHAHESCELVYYVNGKGLTTVFGETIYNFRYDEDSVIVIPPHFLHEEFAQEDTEVVCTKLDLPAELLSQAVFLKMTPKTAELFRKIKAKLLQQAEGKENSAEEAKRLRLLVIHLLSERNKEKTAYFLEFVDLVKEHIRKNFLGKINFAILAEEYGYSYDRLRHIFVRYTGMTLWAYQQGLKLNYAKQMLVISDTPIEKLAKTCGFTGSPRFSHWFNEMVGVSPRKYRNMNKAMKWGVVLNLADMRERSMTQDLIIDTDLGCDCDDAMAIAIANAFQREKFVNLLCITHCLSDADAGRCIDYIGRYFGNNIDIGISDARIPDMERYLERYVYKLRDEFDRSKKLHRAVDLIKEKLSAAEDGSVTMVFIGQLNNLAALLADGEGESLVKSKVKAINIMGGNFENYGEQYTYKDVTYKAEFNIGLDIASAKSVVSDYELPLTFVDFNQGLNVLTGAAVKDRERNPVGRIYKLFGVENRESWDVITVLYSIFGGGGMFEVSPAGRVEIDDEGRTRFSAGGGNHRVLTLNKVREATEQINEILLRINEVNA